MAKPRTTWSGILHFGEVKIPVGFVKAIDSGGVHFQQFTEDGDPVGNQSYNKVTGETIDRSEIKKGMKAKDGTLVFITPEDIESLAPESSKDLTITQFVESVDARYLGDPQYLIPQEGAEVALNTFREALDISSTVAIASQIVTGKLRYFLLSEIQPNSIGLQVRALRSASEVREAPVVTVTEYGIQDLPLMVKLIDQFSGTFDPTKLEDTQKAAILALVESRAASQTPSLSESLVASLE